MSNHKSDLLVSFDFRHQRLLFGLIALFVVVVSLRLNGWSLPMWHRVIDESPRNEILIGKERDIRSDDWLLDLPVILAQSAHKPQFPRVNQNIGFGQVMLAPVPTPVRGLGMLIRPFSWGFIFSNDIGLAWMWWGMSIGIFYSFFLVFMLFSNNSFKLSIFGALLVLFSPYFQFWSLHKAPIAIHWAICLVALVTLIGSRSRRIVWMSGALLGWSFAAMALGHLYPPIFVSLGWLLPFAILAWVLNSKSKLDWQYLRNERFAALGLAATVSGLIFLSFLIESGELISLIRNTVYPGRRFSTGGGYPIWAFFSHSFFAVGVKRNGNWLGNICECSSFVFTFPLTVLLTILIGVKQKKWIDFVPVVLTIYLFFVGLYTYVGFPEFLARITLFGMSTSNRTQLGLGIADIIILITLLSKSNELTDVLSKSTRWFGLLAWMSLLLCFGLWFHTYWPALRIRYVLLAVGLHGCLAWIWIVQKKPILFAGLLASFSVAYTIGFNPVVQGGAQFLLENALSKKIIELNKENKGKYWVSMGNGILGNLFQVLGVPSLGGYHGYPHFKLWYQLDPSRLNEKDYNQAAFVNFVPSGSMTPVFTSPSPGVLQVEIHPESSYLQEIGADIFLVEQSNEMYFKKHLFKKIFSYSGKSIFQRIIN